MKTVTVQNLTIGEGMPKICIPIVAIKKDDILKEAKRISRLPADMIELRMDWFEQVKNSERVLELLKDVRSLTAEMPLLFTFRSKREGGETELPFQAYCELLNQAAGSGQIDMIDVETFFEGIPSEITAEEEQNTLAFKQMELIRQVHEKGVIVIGSNHDFQKTPDEDEIIRRLCIMQEWKADIVKIAVMPKKDRDVLTLLSATERMKNGYAKCPVITMSMGEKGIISRLAGEVFGSAVTFGSAGKASAPGQIDVSDLKQIMLTLHN